MAEDAQYTDEQLQKIARHFLYVTPHGEAADIVKDLKKVVKKGLVSDDWVKNAMSEYNKKRFEIVEGDASKVICCPQAEVQQDVYLHPDKKIVCSIDPVAQKITKEEDGDHLVGHGRNEEFRAAIASKLKEYLAAFYEDGTSPNSVAKGMGSVFVSNVGAIAIVISWKNLNQNNYWTGGWQSEWTLSIAKAGTAKLDGRIRLNVHYFEDGNVQLNSNFGEEAQLEVTDPEETADALLSIIQNLENDFQKKLDQFYVQMHDTTFKNMRRFLPKTGKKMDWRARTHNLVSEAAAQ